MSEAEITHAARVLVAVWGQANACEREYWRLLTLAYPTAAEEEETKAASARRHQADETLEEAMVTLARAVKETP